MKNVMKEKSSSTPIALITGGASGIGLAIARKFVHHKIRTIITGRNRSKLDEARAMLGEGCIALTVDLNSPETLPAFVEEVEAQFGPIHTLVNNAGINLKKNFAEVTDQEFMNIIQTNVLGVFALSREVVKYMLPRKKGVIINISSMAAQYGIPKVIAYTASKSAIEGMTRAMAVELSPAGIRINCIAPGFINTNMSSAALNGDPERKQKVLSRTPVGKLGDPEDVANAAYFLASDESSFMTGAVIPVDGGNAIGF
jgi:NAD(P)-dependent dehydrogenase (short-subunit alcohol dehydrogenase family)